MDNNDKGIKGKWMYLNSTYNFSSAEFTDYADNHLINDKSALFASSADEKCNLKKFAYLL